MVLMFLFPYHQPMVPRGWFSLRKKHKQPTVAVACCQVTPFVRAISQQKVLIVNILLCLCMWAYAYAYAIVKTSLKKMQASLLCKSCKMNKCISLNASKECLVLQDGCKTVARVSQATEEELMDCSLDHDTAQKIINFFEKDCIQIWV